MTTERMEVQRTIEAPPAAIFEILADPQGHVTIDSSGMLLDATGDPVSAVGDRFVVHMDREALNDYPMRLDIYEGDAPELARDRPLGTLRLSGLPSAAAGEVLVMVDFTVDGDGILTVAARELASGTRTDIQVTPSSGLARADVRRLAVSQGGR